MSCLPFPSRTLWLLTDAYYVQDVPEDVAGWAGRKVGDVERFDDNIDNAYDAGRDEQRYEDDRY